MDKNPLVRGASQYLATLKEAQEQLKDNQILLVAFDGEYQPMADYPLKKSIQLYEYETDIESLTPNSFTQTSLIEVYLPSKIKIIPSYFLAGAERLETLVLPIGLEIIEGEAIAGCTSIKNLELPSGLKKIGPVAFAECTSLDLVIPDTVTEIGEDAFSGMPHITYHGSAEGAPWGALSMN